MSLLIWNFVGFFRVYLSFFGDINMHFMLGADDFNAIPSAVVMASVMNSTTSSEKIFFHVVGEGMNQTNINMLASLKEYFRPFKFEYVRFDMLRLSKFNTDIYHSNKKTVIKLFAPELFPDVNKILWMDHDMLILKNIRELFETDMEENYIATTNLAEVSNYCIKQKITRWLHGGIDLLNLKSMRRDDLQKKLLEATKLYHRRKSCGGLDEYALTAVINENRVIILPHRYNLFVRYFWDIRFNNGSCFNNESSFFRLYNDEKDKCVVLHFIGKGKPWEEQSKDLPEFCSLYATFFNLTQFAVKGHVSLPLPFQTTPRSSGRSGSEMDKEKIKKNEEEKGVKEKERAKN